VNGRTGQRKRWQAEILADEQAGQVVNGSAGGELERRDPEGGVPMRGRGKEKALAINLRDCYKVIHGRVRKIHCKTGEIHPGGPITASLLARTERCDTSIGLTADISQESVIRPQLHLRFAPLRSITAPQGVIHEKPIVGSLSTSASPKFTLGDRNKLFGHAETAICSTVGSH
jgi:hypothetical protein